MSDLRNWLHKNNLEQYADAFEANDVDLDLTSTSMTWNNLVSRSAIGGGF
jgi:hypothetical protein